MRKPDLANAIAEKADLTKEQASRVLNAVLEEITNALHRKDSVTLVGFGTFIQRHRGARTGQNPQTGEPVKIKASNTVAFKPGKFLKDSVNPSVWNGPLLATALKNGQAGSASGPFLTSDLTIVRP